MQFRRRRYALTTYIGEKIKYEQEILFELSDVF